MFCPLVRQLAGRRDLDLPVLERVSNPEAELLIHRDHVLVRCRVAGLDRIEIALTELVNGTRPETWTAWPLQNLVREPTEPRT